MSCRHCPAAFIIAGATPGDQSVLCKALSTRKGLRDGGGPISVVTERDSPASLHAYCLGDLAAYADDVDALGPMATEQQRAVAMAQRRPDANHDVSYADCVAWRMERDSSTASKLVDQPGQRRVHGLPSAA